jgi:hypothetical protein
MRVSFSFTFAEPLAVRNIRLGGKIYVRLEYFVLERRPVRVDELVKRVEGALAVLELIVGDLKDLGEALKGLVGECKSRCEVSVESVRGMIPERLHAHLRGEPESDL